MDWILWLHIVAVLLAFALLPGLGLTMRFIAATCEQQTVRNVFTKVGTLLNIGGGAIGVTVITGLVLAAKIGFLQPWLIATYVLVVLTGILANTIDAPWAKRLAAAEGATFDAVRKESLPALAIYLYLAAWFAIAWLNIVKPGAST